MKIYTIRDIAQMADVSVTTVSRVLNDRPDVSRATQEKVRRVMEACHFVGNAHARGLKQAEGDLVAVIIRGRRNPFLNELAEAISQCAQESRAAFVTEYIDERDDEFSRALTLIGERRITGIIFVGSRIDGRCAKLADVNIPMVFTTVSTLGTALEARASSVSIDDERMAREAVEALLARGHRRVAVFGGDPEGADSLALRARGAREALAAHGLPLPAARYIETRLTLDAAYAAALEYFRQGDADAAFCMSDTAAMGVMRALSDLGRRVPEDVSVLGVDGVDIGAFLTPRLSTIAQPVQELARQSVGVLREMMERGAPARHVTVGAELVLRESVRSM
ncbi:MAG: LacI family DNA-binding transcriptional regulator [Clostridia bacterium]|nr:LacI family DNA-binding transcriptional regulator [Clostridia bacterium]